MFRLKRFVKRRWPPRNRDRQQEVEVEESSVNKFDSLLRMSSERICNIMPFGYIADFSRIPNLANLYQSEHVELFLNKAIPLVDLSKLVDIREHFLVFEDNFQNSMFKKIQPQLTYAGLYRACSSYENTDAMRDHDMKSEISMQHFQNKGFNSETAKACAFAISFYIGLNDENNDQATSTLAKISNDEINSVLENSHVTDASIIMYYLIRGLSCINFYLGTVIRSINLDEDELKGYQPGMLITWLQFNRSLREEASTDSPERHNTIISIFSISGRRVGELSDPPNEDEILFLPHSCFLVTNAEKRGKLNRIFLRQIELGLCHYSVLWVDDHILDETWENKRHMEDASTLGAGANIHFIPKVNTDSALIFLQSVFGQRLKGQSTFRIITDMYRENEFPQHNAGARLLLGVRKLGFGSKCLVFTQRVAESTRHIEGLLNRKQRENVVVTTSVTALEEFISFK